MTDTLRGDAAVSGLWLTALSSKVFDFSTWTFHRPLKVSLFQVELVIHPHP